jgi:thiol-disulfide isomerase/thioredoxin
MTGTFRRRLATLAVVAAVAAAGAKTIELKDQKAPRIRLDTLHGYHFDSAKLRRKVVVYEFWSTSCGACRMSLPRLQRVYDWIDDEELDAALYPIHLSGTADDVRDCWRDLKLTMPVLLDVDEAAFRAYRCDSFPTMVVVVDAIVREVHVGYDENLAANLQRTVQRWLHEP